VTFAGGDSIIGEGGTFATTAHELFHTLGGIDLYGPWGGCYDMNRGFTLMAGTGGDHMPDSEWITNLDPWHKMLVGWIEPPIIPMGGPGSAQLAAQHLAVSAEPVRKRSSTIPQRANPNSFFSNTARPAGWAMTRACRIPVLSFGMFSTPLAACRRTSPPNGRTARVYSCKSYRCSCAAGPTGSRE
jgi:hypothetical protein